LFFSFDTPFADFAVFTPVFAIIFAAFRRFSLVSRFRQLLSLPLIPLFRAFAAADIFR
jgi:hypothetical protein